MKKVMILGVMAIMAVTLKAATVSWSVGPNAWSATKPASGNLYYVVLATDIAGTTDLGKALASGKTADLTAALSALSTKSTGTFANAGGIASGDLASDALVDGKNYSVALIAFDAATIAGATKYLYTTDSATGTAYTALTPGNKVTAAWTANGTKVAGTWANLSSGSSVPEPTSGLLMLLGLAGLALKRKRA